MLKYLLIFILLLVAGGVVLLLVFQSKGVFQDGDRGLNKLGRSMSQMLTPSPTPFTRYVVPEIEDKNSITILLVGDSMTAALGPHPSRLSKLLNERYDKQFAIDNYSEGSKSILSLRELLTREIQINGTSEKAAIERDFDILIIESFGHNPLSEYPLEEGLELQEEILDETMLWLIKDKPKAVIIFLATFAPDDENYARGAVGLTSEASENFAIERKKYIENFIEYAGKRQIPLINMYEQSYNPDGTFRKDLIFQLDNIHPSQEGIELIQENIFEFIDERGLLGG
jgi:lysophospholipase L1-like esterase